MHKFLIAAVLSLFATIANAAPSCMSKQVCIDSERGYCRYTTTDNGRCWSTNRTFLKKVKAGKAGHSERRHKPSSVKETRALSEPPVTREPKNRSGPNDKREPTMQSEPYHETETTVTSEPAAATEPHVLSEPFQKSEPKNVSGLRPIAKSKPPSTREPKRSSWDVTLLGVFTFATAFMGFTASRVLNEHPLYWGNPTLPPPPLDLAKSPYRLIPGAAPDMLHLPREHSANLRLVTKH